MPRPAPIARLGRKPKSIQAHLRDGTYRPERHGPIPDGQIAEMMGSVSEPPSTRPSDLCPEADWAWTYICEHGVGLKPGDYMLMETIVRMWAEWKRCVVMLPTMNPRDDEYGKLSRTTNDYSRRLDGLLSSFGMNPASRAKMYVASNLRALSDPADDDDEEDESLPVGQTALDLYRPDGAEVAG